ncbi:MHYT domain-containing protein [Streptomyces sp. NPDC027717]|uniref:MHYT domain-containing protein n=1 Tax=Streptomyces sp. NPDC027717 TaxID=3155765 RepID=UPI0033F99E6B
MRGTIDGFSYGVVTPLVGYVMACLGGALGLRCTTRSLLVTHSWRPAWLALGSTAIGSGVWTMHFIAMMGFSIDETPIRFDKPMTYASLGLAIVMVGVGIFIIGYRGATGASLVTGGTITGLGVASMHYLGMAGMRFDGRFTYDLPSVVASVVIAVVAASVALWAAGHVRGLMGSIGASLVMGLAVSGMHYTGMAGLTVHLHGTPGTATSGSPATVLAPILIGPLAFLVLAAAVVLFDPLMVKGAPRHIPEEPKPGVPAAAVASHQRLRAPQGPSRRPVHAEAHGSRTPQRH